MYMHGQIIQVVNYNSHLGPHSSMQHVQLPEVLTISTTKRQKVEGSPMVIGILRLEVIPESSMGMGSWECRRT